jgi:DNA-binding NtrC family response regulator
MTAVAMTPLEWISVAERASPKTVLPISAIAEGSTQKNAESRKALLVDDNLDLLNLAAHLFQLLGFEVLTATSGEKALEILRQTHDINVLFSDVVMPGLDGIQLGHEARDLMPEIKVILVSGFHDPETLVGHGSVHDFDYLSKPYRMADIEKVLAKGK